LKKALLIISIFFIASNLSFAQTERVNANKSSILNDTIYMDDLLSKLRRDPKLGTQDVSFQEWEQIKKILESQKKEEISLRDEYILCFVECKKYLQAKQIGNAIYCANTFEKKYKPLKNDVLLINIYNLFVTIYEESNMLDDALIYMRLRYKLQCKNKSLYDRNDDYKINIMALLRLKEWSKAIKISKRALKNYGLDATSKDDIYLNYIRKLYCYMANSYAQLNNRDSAFYYMDQPLMFQIKPTDRNVYIAEKKAYLDGDELMEFIRVLSVLKENKKAAALAYRAAYSPYQFKRKDFREFVKSKYSRIFYTAGMYKEAAEGYKLFSEITDSTKQEEINTLIEKQITHNRIELANINEINNKKEEISKKQLERQILVRNLFIAGFSLFLIFSIVILFQRNKIKKGKLLSDELLLNILPYTIAEELKLKGNAESKLIDMVTVLFTDFKGFTQLSEQFTPQELVAEINECFSAFDKIMIKYNVEKIKTIGDAYMAAGGLPTSNQTHAEDVICAALEIQQYMSDYKKARQEAGKLFFEIRIGIHSGPVVAGIVGIKKFAYDIWGDTVNIASRMESSGEVGKVNVSETTYELTRENFNFEYRGKIAAKGKGEISMFFVENKS